MGWWLCVFVGWGGGWYCVGGGGWGGGGGGGSKADLKGDGHEIHTTCWFEEVKVVFLFESFTCMCQ